MWDGLNERIIANIQLSIKRLGKICYGQIKGQGEQKRIGRLYDDKIERSLNGYLKKPQNSLLGKVSIIDNNGELVYIRKEAMTHSRAIREGIK